MRKSYSLMDWLIVFSILLAVLAMFRSGVKRTVAGKVQSVSNFMLFQRWPADSASTNPTPNDPEFKPDINVQIKTGQAQNQTQTIKEDSLGTVVYTNDSNHTTRSAMVAVPDGQEDLLITKPLNTYGADIDARKDK